MSAAGKGGHAVRHSAHIVLLIVLNLTITFIHCLFPQGTNTVNPLPDTDHLAADTGGQFPTHTGTLC
jgi:hypothetical protein